VFLNEIAMPILKVHELLQEGHTVGWMGDRPMSNQTELVSFMGKLVPFDVTPFRVAAICQSNILFSFGFKDVKNTYEFFATPAKKYVFSFNEPKELQIFE